MPIEDIKEIFKKLTRPSKHLEKKGTVYLVLKSLLYLSVEDERIVVA